MDATRLTVVIAAREEADRIAATVEGVREAFPGAHVIVADDGSRDDTAQVAAAAGAEVVRLDRPAGKGGAAGRAAERALARGPELVLLCDADLAASAARLAPLLEAIDRGEADLAVAVFARRVGGGFGFAVGFARGALPGVEATELRLVVRVRWPGLDFNSTGDNT